MMSAAPSGTASQITESISASRAHRRLAQLRRRLIRRRRVRDLEIHVSGAARAYEIAVPADPDGVLDELAAPEPHMPYWATPWPSGLALAEVALARRGRLAGRRVLELGCGLGATATALVECGARVTGIDCFGEALAYTRYNVARNVGRTPGTLRLDWRTAEGAGWLAAQRVDVVLAADVLYEPEDVAPLLALGEDVLRRGCVAALPSGWPSRVGRRAGASWKRRASAAGAASTSPSSVSGPRRWAARSCASISLSLSARDTSSSGSRVTPANVGGCEPAPRAR
jgi:predicted nicotinamide N-methyase